MLFFGRTTDKKTDTFARGFGLAQLIGARAYRRVFRRCLRRLFALLLRPGSVFATVRYYFVFRMVFRFCLLDV